MRIGQQVRRLKCVSVAAVVAVSMGVSETVEARCIVLSGGAGWATLFASGGAYGFKITMAARAELPVGRLFRLNAAGQEERIWQRTLVDIPNTVIIAPDLRTVVTINDGCGTSKTHALVLYGFDGRLVADHAFDDIVPEKNWPAKVTVSSVGMSWAEGTQFSFDPDTSVRNHLVITFPDGSQTRIDRTTGRVFVGESVVVKLPPNSSASIR